MPSYRYGYGPNKASDGCCQCHGKRSPDGHTPNSFAEFCAARFRANGPEESKQYQGPDGNDRHDQIGGSNQHGKERHGGPCRKGRG